MHNNDCIKTKKTTRRPRAQAWRKSSEQYHKQWIDDLLDQCGDICRDTRNEKCLKFKYVSQLKHDDVRKNFLILRLSTSRCQKYIKKNHQETSLVVALAENLVFQEPELRAYSLWTMRYRKKWFFLQEHNYDFSYHSSETMVENYYWSQTFDCYDWWN